MERKLINYLPPVMQELREFKALMQTEQVQAEQLYDYIDKAYNNQFVMDADEYGVSRWEKLLRISSKSTESFADRKINIIAKLNEQIPYTIRTLKSQLETICNKGTFEVDMDNNNYILGIKLYNTGNSIYFNVRNMLNRMIPANLLVDMMIQSDLPVSYVDILNRKNKISLARRITLNQEV